MWYVYLVTALVLVLSLIVFKTFTRRLFTSKRTILIVGPCDSGKTTLFARLLYGKDDVGTFTSMSCNSGRLTIEKSTLDVVDVPGHERIRNAFVDKYKSSVRAIIYVVDSVTIQKQIRDSTEFLFKLLSDPVIHSNRPPVSIVCNKQDESMAKGMLVIRKELEKEINLLRDTHSKSLLDTNDSSANRIFLGKPGAPFTFSNLKNKIEFLESSSREGNLSAINDWLKGIA